MNICHQIQTLQEKLQHPTAPDEASRYYVDEIVTKIDLRRHCQLARCLWLEKAVTELLSVKLGRGLLIQYFDTSRVEDSDCYLGQGYAGPHMVFFFYFQGINQGAVVLFEEPDGGIYTADLSIPQGQKSDPAFTVDFERRSWSLY